MRYGIWIERGFRERKVEKNLKRSNEFGVKINYSICLIKIPAFLKYLNS